MINWSPVPIVQYLYKASTKAKTTCIIIFCIGVSPKDLVILILTISSKNPTKPNPNIHNRAIKMSLLTPALINVTSRIAAMIITPPIVGVPFFFK